MEVVTIALIIFYINILFATYMVVQEKGEKYPALKGLFWPMYLLFAPMKEIAQLFKEIAQLLKEIRKG